MLLFLILLVLLLLLLLQLLRLLLHCRSIAQTERSLMLKRAMVEWTRCMYLQCCISVQIALFVGIFKAPEMITWALVLAFFFLSFFFVLSFSCLHDASLCPVIQLDSSTP